MGFQPSAFSSQLSVELAAKRDRLLELLESYGSCVVAFSGGLDSSVLAKAAQLALGDRAVAVTATSASMPTEELDEAVKLAGQIGIRHEVVETDEISNPDYQKNEADRCYHCRIEILGRIKSLARQLDAAVVADGANRDDQGEHRPGLRAGKEQKVRSPLAECGLRKSELRKLAAVWGLSVWNKSASPCLSSRIAYGEQITPERLAMVGRAERFLRGFGFEPLRVRYHKGDVARIEVSPEALSKFLDAEFCRKVVEELKSGGFKYVSLDLEGFRSGSLNDLLKAEDIEKAES